MEGRTIEIGFLCEACLKPLEDSPPLAEDWRVPVGRTVRLCPDCEDINKIGERITGKLDRASALLTAFEWGLQEIIKVRQ